MKTLFKVNSTEYDLDTSITLSFSCEVLKKILVGLNTRNEQLSEKVNDLTKKYDDLKRTTDTDKKYNKEANDQLYLKLQRIEKSIKAMKDNNNNEEGGSGGINENNEQDKDKSVNLENNLDNQSKKKDSDELSNSSSLSHLVGSGSNVHERGLNSDHYNEVNKRVSEIEMKLSKCVSLSDINSINQNQQDLGNKLKGIEFLMNDLRVKVQDFDIQDLLKESKIESGNIDAAKLLYLSLEKTIKGKFELIDSRQVQSTEDIISHQTLFEAYKLTNQNEIKKINDQIGNLTDKIKDIESKCSSNSNRGDAFKIEGSIIVNENDSKLANDSNFQELKKGVSLLKVKIKDIEKSIKKLTTDYEPEAIIKDINALKAFIDQKASKEDMAKAKESLITLENIIIPLKDSYEKNDEEMKKSASAIVTVMKKLENLQSLITAKTSMDNIAKITKGTGENNCKYMEISLFNDFISVFNREVDRLKKDYDDIYQKVDNISTDLKLKAMDTDLKSVEEYLVNKIEDFKYLSQKKFADKIDSHKNFKYLELQIKQVIDGLFKTTSSHDKGDNWLLAKKPIGGFSCASCESYIGDLQEKKEYIHWNKYPTRIEPGMEQTMRTGNGFSHMLHMINIDQSANNNNKDKDKDKENSNSSGKNVPAKLEQEDTKIYESDGEITNKSIDTKKKLPKLNNYRSTGELGMYISEDIYKINHESNINIYSTSKEETQLNKLQDELQPRLIKIFKKNRKTKTLAPNKTNQTVQ